MAGRFLLLCSASLDLVKGVTETLAARNIQPCHGNTLVLRRLSRTFISKNIQAICVLVSKFCFLVCRKRFTNPVWSGVVYPNNPPNAKKRLIKSPKVCIRCVGVLHKLLNIKSFDALQDHPHHWQLVGNLRDRKHSGLCAKRSRTLLLPYPKRGII